MSEERKSSCLWAEGGRPCDAEQTIQTLTAQLTAERELRERAEADVVALRDAGKYVIECWQLDPERQAAVVGFGPAQLLDHVLSQPHPGDELRERLNDLTSILEDTKETLEVSCEDCDVHDSGHPERCLVVCCVRDSYARIKQALNAGKEDGR